MKPEINYVADNTDLLEEITDNLFSFCGLEFYSGSSNDNSILRVNFYEGNEQPIKPPEKFIKMARFSSGLIHEAEKRGFFKDVDGEQPPHYFECEDAKLYCVEIAAERGPPIMHVKPFKNNDKVHIGDIHLSDVDHRKVVIVKNKLFTVMGPRSFSEEAYLSAMGTAADEIEKRHNETGFNPKIDFVKYVG
ncbi:hypothetical protein HOC32_00745 [Candidatus Woesearchaeota archaeon]|jgi:hypothetical protein|nr:hypothetical protein [Candidatus Woesearchaeota archaeon]